MITDTPYSDLAQSEQALALVTTDRDIKAANLQLLVEKVLAYEESCTRCEDQGNDGADVYEAGLLWSDLLNLARSLKQ